MTEGGRQRTEDRKQKTDNRKLYVAGLFFFVSALFFFPTPASASQPLAGAVRVSTVKNTAVALALIANDAANDPLTYQIVTAPQHGVLSGQAPNLTYTPAENYLGQDYFTYTASDATLTSSTGIVYLTITTGISHSLTVSSIPASQGFVTRTPYNEANSYEEGSDVRLFAVADFGYKFTHWTGTIDPVKANDNPLSLKIDADNTIVANFEPAPVDNAKSPLGMNLTTFDYWDRGLPFKNVFRQRMTWQLLNTKTWARSAYPESLLDTDGWPTSLPQDNQITVGMLQGAGGHYQAGKYVCLFEGAGTFGFGWDANGASAKVDPLNPNRYTFNVPKTSDSGIELVIKTMTQPIKNIRIMPIEFEINEAENPWHPTFLNNLSHFNTIRFMWWMRAWTGFPDRYGPLQRATLNTITLDPNASNVQDYYKDMSVQIDGTWKNRMISAYDPITKTATLTAPWNDYYNIYASGATKDPILTGVIQGFTPTTLTLDSAASNSPDAYKNLDIVIRKSTDNTIARLTITAYDAATKTVTVSKVPTTTYYTFKYVRDSEILKATHSNQQGPSGVSLELIVDLCNRINASPWFCIPSAEPDAYIEKFAAYVRDYLKPGLKPVVEYSNETWGGCSARYVDAKGAELGIGGWAYHAYRATQMFKIWNRVYGEKDLRLERTTPSRFIRTLASQNNYLATGTTIMDFNGTVTKPEYYLTHPEDINPIDPGHIAADYADTLAVTNYIGETFSAAYMIANEKDLNPVIDRMKKEVIDQMSLGGERYTNLLNARSRGLDLIIYEAGTSVCTASDKYRYPGFNVVAATENTITTASMGNANGYYKGWIMTFYNPTQDGPGEGQVRTVTDYQVITVWNPTSKESQNLSIFTVDQPWTALPAVTSQGYLSVKEHYLEDKLNREPRMTELYNLAFNKWKETDLGSQGKGYKIFTVLVYIQMWNCWGRWGHLEYFDQDTEKTPRWKVMTDWIANNPLWWDNNTPPPSFKTFKWSTSTTTQDSTGKTITAVGGTVSPSGYQQPVRENDPAAFTITANPGYKTVGVWIDNVAKGVLASYTFPAVTADHTIRAAFMVSTSVYGDVSGDNEVTAYDAAMVAQASINSISFTADQTKAADVSGDNEVTAYDAALIAQKAVGLIDKFPVEG